VAAIAPDSLTSVIDGEYIYISGPGVAKWLRRCATSRKVPGSIAGGFFPRHPTSPWARGRLSLSK
jgi:hypothetical protein